MPHPAKKKRIESQRKNLDEWIRRMLKIDDAFKVILSTSDPKSRNSPDYSAEMSEIIETAKVLVADYPHLLKFLQMWENNELEIIL